MPNHCCVSGCKGNNNDPKNSVSVFSFPKDPCKAGQWLKAIHRSDYKLRKSSRVCIKHFDERFIVREDSVKRPDGSVLTVKRSQLKLTKDAIPTLFPNLPKYLSTVLPPKRKDPGQRRREIEARIENAKTEEKLQVRIREFNRNNTSGKSSFTSKTVRYCATL